jgi:neopullulanase
MKKSGSGQVNDYWTATLTAPYHRIKYTFEVIGNDGSHVIFGDRSIEKFSDEKLREDGIYFKVPYFHDIDRIKTPKWLKDIVWYQIFPERFANGDKSNDPVNVKPWNPEDHPGREDFYGGDLQGVLDHLDDLQKLGRYWLIFLSYF